MREEQALPYRLILKQQLNSVGVGALDDPFINKIKRVFGTDEVSENSSLEKLLFLKIGSKDSRGRLSLQN